MTKIFRILGWLEGISFLSLLFIAMPLKYYAQQPETVKVLGPIHGVLFLIYCFLAFLIASDQEWPRKKHFLAYAAAIFPFGTFIFEMKYLRQTPQPSQR